MIKAKVMLSITQLCDVVKWGLEQQNADPHNKGRKLQIKSVSFSNNTTMVCEFYPSSKTSMEIKTEIGFIMGFMFSFFDENPNTPKSLKFFGVRAFNKDDEEIMHAMSSVATAGYTAQGRSIEWLRNTIFQDNTDKTRLSMAKKKIAEIENTLRKQIIEVLSTNNGINWWTTSVPVKIRNDATRAYNNQYGVISTSGEELIYFTYLLQLKTIIVSNWADFSTTFPVQADFETWIEDLNRIRRDEGHNRPISYAALAALNLIHNSIMSCIAATHPHLAIDFRVANWQQQVREIMIEYSENQVQFATEPGQDLANVVSKMKEAIVQLEDLSARLSSIPVPFSKNSLHQQLLQAINNLKRSFEAMVSSSDSGDIEEVKATVEQNTNARKELRSFLSNYLASET